MEMRQRQLQLRVGRAVVGRGGGSCVTPQREVRPSGFIHSHTTAPHGFAFFHQNPKFKPQADTLAHTVDARTLREFGRRVFRGANAECIDSEREDGASELVATRCFLSKHDANQSRIKVCVGFPTEQVTPANACKPAAGADVVCLQTIASSFGCIMCCDSCPAFPFAIFALDQRRSGRG